MSDRGQKAREAVRWTRAWQHESAEATTMAVTGTPVPGARGGHTTLADGRRFLLIKNPEPLQDTATAERVKVVQTGQKSGSA